MIAASAQALDEHPSRGFRGYVLTAVELAALIDLGLTDSQLGDYFRVKRERIVGLKTFYGLARTQ